MLYPVYILGTLIKNQLTQLTAYSQVYFHVSILCMIVFVPLPYCINYQYSLQYILNSGNVIFPVLFFFFKIVLALLGLLRFHIYFRMGFSIASKSDIGILIRIASKLQITLGSIVFLTVLNLQIHEHRLYFHFFRSQFLPAMLCSFQYTSLLPCR